MATKIDKIYYRCATGGVWEIHYKNGRVRFCSDISQLPTTAREFVEYGRERIISIWGEPVTQYDMPRREA